MRVCPKCGYKDLLIWRNNPHRLYTQYCKLHELETWNAELSKIIEEKRDVKINGYIYHINKAKVICRIHESDSIDGISFREPRTEKHLMKKFLPENQTKLLK